MTIKYIIYNGNDYGVIRNTVELHHMIKSDEGKGFSEIELLIPSDWDLIKWKTGDICSFIIENNNHFFLYLDFKVKNVFSNKVILTSKDYVDFQPIFRLGSQI